MSDTHETPSSLLARARADLYNGPVNRAAVDMFAKHIEAGPHDPDYDEAVAALHRFVENGGAKTIPAGRGTKVNLLAFPPSPEKLEPFDVGFEPHQWAVNVLAKIANAGEGPHNPYATEAANALEQWREFLRHQISWP